MLRHAPDVARTLRLMVFALLLTGCASAPRASAADATDPLVLTGLQATYSLATALVKGTPIAVRNVPADGRELPLQKDYLERRMATLAPTFAAATAVITVASALPADPLYRYARTANIRIVNIDAATPWTPDAAGVALAEAPASNVAWGANPDPPAAGTAPYFWLSVSNAVRMADIIAHDLIALFPASAPDIARNLEVLKRELLQLRSSYQQRLIDAGGDVLFALTGDFVYLTNDLAMLVDGYFLKQDLRWSRADLDGLTRHLREHGIGVVLHRWQPNEAIQEAIRAGGARLVVLEAGDPGIAIDGALAADGLQRLLKSNLEALVGALQAP